MFKSTFSKYLIAFIIIILISFLMLSGLITSIIEEHLSDEKEENLLSTSMAIESYVLQTNPDLEDIQKYAGSLSHVIIPFINYDKDLEIILVDTDGNICLSTLGVEPDQNGIRAPRTDIDHATEGKIYVPELFATKNSSDNSEVYFVHSGDLDGALSEKHIAFARAIVTGGVTRGYVISLFSMAKVDNLISVTRRAVFNSSAWVLLAAVIAVYFITERIIHPLRSMTSAAKQFAKGDFDTRVTVSGRDEVAELGNAFNNMADSLQNLEKMRMSFLASVSHDLRTPMTTISGFIEGINSGAIPPEKHEYYLGIISNEIHRLSRLVSELLDVSRLESGDRKFNFENFDIAEVARIILISFEKKIEERELQVEFDAECDEMPVYADKDAIHQVLYNLCHNAIKFSDVGGKFEIRISKYQANKIRISVFNEGQIIPSEDIPMIFERFYKSDKSRGLDKNGVGLGLYISKTIVDAHNEGIFVESVDGRGTEFWFTLKLGESHKRKNNLLN